MEVTLRVGGGHLYYPWNAARGRHGASGAVQAGPKREGARDGEGERSARSGSNWAHSRAPACDRTSHGHGLAASF
jgi:hypothetical protein